MSKEHPALGRLLSPRAIAQATTIPRSTIYDLVARGELPSVRIGSWGVRIREEDWLRYVESRSEVTL